jgi:uncharacterized protein YraI
MSKSPHSAIRPLLAGLVLLAGMLIPAVAEASRATASLNMRAGPGTKYARIAVIPPGGYVHVYSCTRGGGWCRVSHRGAQGWASGRYLTGVRAAYVPHRVYRTRPRVSIYVGPPAFGFYYGNYPRYRYPYYRYPYYRYPYYGRRPFIWGY